jgi:hypothetical protein
MAAIFFNTIARFFLVETNLLQLFGIVLFFKIKFQKNYHYGV